MAMVLSGLACSGVGLPAQAPAQHPAAAVRFAEPSAVLRNDVGFRTPRLLEEHYRKHGREVGARSEADYLRMAQALRDRPAGGAVLEEERSDGVLCRFDRSTGLFLAYEQDGVIKTCFRPNDGEAYFRHQMNRGHGR
jgi:pyocin large subunit-like protein